MALLRGHMMEGVAELQKQDRTSDYFILGMFSLLDVILDQPMRQALEGLALPDDVRERLVCSDERMGRLLKLVKAIENGDWQEVDSYARGKGLCSGDLMFVYTRSIHGLKDNTAMFEAV